MEIMTLLSLALSIYMVFGLFLFLKQRQFIYTPAAKTDHPFPVEIFSYDDVSIEVIVLNPGMKDAILYFGGSAEAVVSSADAFQRSFPAHSVYLVNYRGYAGSSGSPSEQGFYADALYIFDLLELRHAHLFVIGRSIGSGVATLVASKRDFDKLILVTPYDSIESVARDRYPLYPMSLLLKDKFNSIARIKDIHMPTLIFVAGDDEVITAKHTNRFIAAFPAAKVEKLVEADHNSFLDQKPYFSTMRQFITTNQ